MKPIYSVAVCAAFWVLALVSGYSNYRSTATALQADLSQALRKTMNQKNGLLARRDTIRACRLLAGSAAGGTCFVKVADETLRRNLATRQLRERAYVVLAFSVDGQPEVHDALHSDTFYVDVSTAGRTARSPHGMVACRSLAECSPLFILSLSDQRGTLLCTVLACLSMAFGIRQRRKWHVAECAVAVPAAPLWGGLSYDRSDGRFFTARHDAVPFTPMQLQLMQLLWESNGRSLSKHDICNALWPKKDNASETLYTLVRRLKAVLARHTNLCLENEGGRYCLREQHEA